MSCILIAEDEPRIAAFMEKGLKRAGFTTVVVTNGSAVVDSLVSGTFDLLLLDLGLPDKDGIEILEDMRRQGFTVPVVVVTARALDLRERTEIGMTGRDVVSKPFLMKDLVQKVRSLLNQ
ncbi:response regulator [Oscillatoria sp. CS-180]|uniref:response regulator n=1 Tax=Oscillatoria sp. CS-180 TaxID=3021720 RepID=UPI002330B4A7|nr:response regulator [Oscillatoria sp. CS-180]MDB9527266.1 response regulator [Oscillatoria sp. CS-180]